MTGINTDWALAELDKFIGQTTVRSVDPGPGIIGVFYETAASDDDITKEAQVVEQILTRVIPDWQSKLGTVSGYDNEWKPLRDVSIRAREVLQRQDEIKQNLGDNAPEISAANLHTWVWSGAASLWQSGHFRSAVEDAAKKVNAETQNKVGRRDLSETKLFQEAFSDKPAQSGKARLRRMADDGSDTYKSVQRGAMALAEGIYAGIRNPFNHEDPTDIDEQVALEYLAALSVLARWVDESTMEASS